MEHIGKPMVFNISELRAPPALQSLVQPRSIVKMLEQKFPAAFLAMNKQALGVGYDPGAKLNA